MTTQQLRAVELVESIRRKRHRNENPTNLINSEPVSTNWGNKLKRSAQHVQEGRLDNPRGSETYTETILYNGFKRRIISRNPLLLDDYGDVVDEEEIIDEADVEPIEENPYKDVKLEEILHPLTSAADLPSHPRMARPYLDKGLNEMIKNAEGSLRKEQDILAAMNELFIKFRGDYDWAPIGSMRTSYDDLLLAKALMGTAAAKQNRNTNGSAALESEVNGDSEKSSTQGAVAEKTEGEDSGQAEQDTENQPGKMDGVTFNETSFNGNGTSANIYGDENNGNQEVSNKQTAEDDNIDPMAVDHAHEEQDEEAEEDAISHRMTTRAQLSALNAPSRSPSPPPIHPFFKPPSPPSIQFDPTNPEEDPLGPLLSYISKQEEVVRLQNELYQGLLKAQRMRKEVYTWCKAEGHVGEMSDGEDWVDLEEWGLQPGELVKGKEEDDNENTITEGTGRRGRRGGRAAGDRER